MKQDIHALLEKYKEGRCTDEEVRRLDAWLNQISEQQKGQEPTDEQISQIWLKIEQTASPKQTKLLNWRRYASVAAAIALLCSTGYVLHRYTYRQISGVESKEKYDIAAGSDRATLILDSGKKITLDSTLLHTKLSDLGIEIISSSDGQIMYKQLAGNDQQASEFPLRYHTIETPKGGKYEIQLSDGTKVWLNANSSITFPIRFAHAQREVQLSGEAYFDVAKISYKGSTAGPATRTPFWVDTDGQHIEVLGTQFNVKSYTDDKLQYTTLVEGSVRVEDRKSNEQIILQPGQQAQSGESLRVTYADLERDLAWKNGDFVFKKEALEEICKQISRWYNIEISYPSDLGTMQYSGMIQRTQPLSVIIKMLESAGKVKAILKERRLIITRLT